MGTGPSTRAAGWVGSAGTAPPSAPSAPSTLRLPAGTRCQPRADEFTPLNCCRDVPGLLLQPRPCPGVQQGAESRARSCPRAARGRGLAALRGEDGRRKAAACGKMQPNRWENPREAAGRRFLPLSGQKPPSCCDFGSCQRWVDALAASATPPLPAAAARPRHLPPGSPKHLGPTDDPPRRGCEDPARLRCSQLRGTICWESSQPGAGTAPGPSRETSRAGRKHISPKTGWFSPRDRARSSSSTCRELMMISADFGLSILLGSSQGERSRELFLKLFGWILVLGGLQGPSMPCQVTAEAIKPISKGEVWENIHTAPNWRWFRGSVRALAVAGTGSDRLKLLKL